MQMRKENGRKIHSPMIHQETEWIWLLGAAPAWKKRWVPWNDETQKLSRNEKFRITIDNSDCRKTGV